LTSGEVDTFLDSLAFDKNTVIHAADQINDAFRKLSPECQCLLARNVESGVISDYFVHKRLDEFCLTLFREWDESGEYESLAEAKAIFDNRTYSTLLVLEYLGSSLDSLGHSPSTLCMWAEMILNEFVDADEEEYPEAAAYRLSSIEDVAAVAALTTYVAVDGVLHDEELLAHSRDTSDTLVKHIGDVYPRCADDQGVHIYKIAVQHPELELKLRGRSLSDYESALRFVRARGLVETSIEDAEYVLESLKMTRPLSNGVL
jgi:hypothetical protein